MSPLPARITPKKQKNDEKKTMNEYEKPILVSRLPSGSEQIKRRKKNNKSNYYQIGFQIGLFK